MSRANACSPHQRIRHVLINFKAQVREHGAEDIIGTYKRLRHEDGKPA
jgi:hypothetical protein